jgi:beta-glucanase (GH16 family)
MMRVQNAGLFPTRRAVLRLGLCAAALRYPPARANTPDLALIGRKRAATAADSARIAALQSRQSGMLFFDNFADPADLERNWSVFTDDRSDLMACRSADSLHPGSSGLQIATVQASHCHDRWSTGEIISKRGFGFGYFEAYLRIAAAPGIDNAFWLTTQGGSNDGSGDEFEIDVAEVMYPNDVHITLHRHNLEKHKDDIELGFDHRATDPLADGYHYYSALWTRDEIIFGFNGQAMGVIETNGVIHGSVNLRVSTALGSFGGAPPADSKGLAMDVKHVRVLSA